MATAVIHFFSQALNRTTTCHVIIPSDKVVAGTRQEEKTPYRTLYLLHGLMGDDTDWLYGTRIQELANTYNLCVVMPSGDNKFYCDSDLSGDYYGKLIGEELVAFTRATFPLSSLREDTFIGGLSMGGFGAIVNGLRHPETFGRVIGLSSALIKHLILGSVDEPGHDFFTRSQYQTMFGLKKIEDFVGSRNDYDALAEQCSKTGVMPRFYLACGSEDGLIEPNRAYKERLLSLGYDVCWQEEPGQHDWAFWDRYIEKALGWLPLEAGEKGASSGNTRG